MRHSRNDGEDDESEKLAEAVAYREFRTPWTGADQIAPAQLCPPQMEVVDSRFAVSVDAQEE